MIIEQDPNAAKVALDTAGDADVTPALARQEHQPRRGPALPARRGPLHRRHQAARAWRTRRSCAARTRTRRSSRIRTEAAEKLPGVIAVVTGKDVASAPIRCRRSAPVRSSRT